MANSSMVRNLPTIVLYVRDYRQKFFSNVSSLPNVLNQMTIELTFENFDQGMYGPWTEADTKTVGKIMLGFSQVRVAVYCLCCDVLQCVQSASFQGLLAAGNPCGCVASCYTYV